MKNYLKDTQISATAVVLSVYLIWKNLHGFSQIQGNSQSYSDVLKALNGRKLRENGSVYVSVCLYTHIYMCQISKAVIKLHVLPFQTLYKAHICNSDIVINLSISIQTTASTVGNYCTHKEMFALAGNSSLSLSFSFYSFKEIYLPSIDRATLMPSSNSVHHTLDLRKQCCRTLFHAWHFLQRVIIMIHFDTTGLSFWSQIVFPEQLCFQDPHA